MYVCIVCMYVCMYVCMRVYMCLGTVHTWSNNESTQRKMYKKHLMEPETNW